MMSRFTYALQIRGVVSSNLDIGRLIVTDGCFISANTKLCDFFKAACLSSEELANQYRDALLPVLRKRYGDGVELEVVDGGPPGQTIDDELVRARIERSMFAPNRNPLK